MSPCEFPTLPMVLSIVKGSKTMFDGDSITRQGLVQLVGPRSRQVGAVEPEGDRLLSRSCQTPIQLGDYPKPSQHGRIRRIDPSSIRLPSPCRHSPAHIAIAPILTLVRIAASSGR